MTEDAPLRLLITAGPTREPIDAVRYLGNRSSGRMGRALAEAAVRCRMPSTLLWGALGGAGEGAPGGEPPHSTLLTVARFQTTADLAAALQRHWPDHDVLLMAAAVADFRPVRPATGKLRRGDGRVTLELEPTPDLLAAAAAAARPDQTVIGFALEPAGRLLESARRKLEGKRVDAIVANPLETMDAERVTATVLLRGGDRLTPPADLAKPDFADWLLGQLPAIRSRPRDP